MTKIEELEQKLNECQKSLAEIQKEITELNELQIELKESKKEKWKPTKEGEIYYCRTVTGVVKAWSYYNNQEHNYIIENQPIFKTKSECARYWHFMDTVKEKSYEFSKEEWEKGNRLLKYYIEFGATENKFRVEYCAVTKGLGAIYFKSFDDAQYIIDNFKDELMEYFV